MPNSDEIPTDVALLETQIKSELQALDKVNDLQIKNNRQYS